MAPTGRIAFASGRAADFDIWVLDLGSGRLSQLTRGEGLNDFPRWSPDRSKLAYISTQEDSLASLWIMSSDGSQQKRLTQNIYCQYPSWSPDGGSLSFTANADSASDIEVCRVSSAGGASETIFKRGGVETQPCWSPDGKYILFAAPDSTHESGVSSRNTDIFEYEIAAKKLKKITSHPAKDFCPRYSPDGSQIAFVSHRNAISEQQYSDEIAKIKAATQLGDMQSVNIAIRTIQSLDRNSDIWVMNRDGSNERRLTDNRATEIGISWSPCGKYLVYSCFTSNATGTERLHILEVATGRSEPIRFDRSPLESEIHASKILNQSLFQRLMPDLLERRLVEPSFWGEEHNPDWA